MGEKKKARKILPGWIKNFEREGKNGKAKGEV